MSLSTIIQRRTHQGGFIRRRVSSTTLKVNSHRTLPDAKMRALISLYHQSDTFVTPENLSKRIDDAFIPHETQSGLGRLSGESLKDLTHALHQLRRKPKLSDWDREAIVSRTTDMITWSSGKGGREWKVIEALYGVDIPPSREVLPGLEVLEESAEPLQDSDGSDDWEAVVQEALRENKN